MEIFGEGNLAGIVLSPIDDQARHFEIIFHRSALDDHVHRAHTLAAADDLEAATLLGFGDDEVLEDPAGLDIERQAFFEFGVRALADVVFALIELVQGNELHDEIAPDVRPDIHRPSSPFPLPFRWNGDGLIVAGVGLAGGSPNAQLTPPGVA